MCRQQMDKNKLLKNSLNGGFTLLELTAAIAIWVILLAGASQLLLSTTATTAKLVDRQEALESARAAVDVLTVNLQMADRIILRTDSAGMLRDLSLRQIDPSGTPHWYDFRYGRIYNRLEFDTNELASNLSEVRITLSDNRQLIFITVTTSEHLGEPITLTGTVDIRYKDLTLR